MNQVWVTCQKHMELVMEEEGGYTDEKNEKSKYVMCGA